MAGVVDVLSSSLLHLGVATSVIVFSLFIFLKYLYKRGSSASSLKSSQRKNVNKKVEGKSNQHTPKSTAKTQLQAPKDPSINSSPRAGKNSSPKAQIPVTIEEDDWVKVKSTKSQSNMSSTKEVDKAGIKTKKADSQSKKSQKQQRKSEMSPKAENKSEEGKNSGDGSSGKGTHFSPASDVEKPTEGEWQEIPSAKRKKQRARKE